LTYASYKTQAKKSTPISTSHRDNGVKSVWRYPDVDAAALVAEILAEREEVMP